MSSAFEDMDMEVAMEESFFEDSRLPIGGSEKVNSGLPVNGSGKEDGGFSDGFTDASAFEGNPFDSEREKAAAVSLPVQEENASDRIWEDAEEENGCLETDDEEEDEEETNKTAEDDTETPAAEKESEDKNRAEHEAAEAKRKAEWEARQQAKKEAEQAQLARMSALSDEEVTAEAMKRVGTDTERLTRRNMKECVSEYIQTLCLEDPAFARLTMHPRKTMIHCFYYINRKAREFVEQEMKDNDIKPENGVYGSDVPDDLCYQWAEEYFRDPDAKEDQEKEEKFVPRAYSGKSSVKSKKTKTAAKKTAGKGKNVKTPEKKPQKNVADEGQFEQMTLAGLAG